MVKIVLIRAKFQKLNPVKYISHLELMNTFRRSFRRAELPVAYSKGYNPHIKLSLCQPLSVGMVGKAEYFDIELSERISTEKFVIKLNKNIPSAVEVLTARQVPENIKSLMAVVNTAVYNIDFKINDKSTSQKLADEFLAADEIKITRLRRNKEDRIIDLRPMIYDLIVCENGNWQFTVSTGSRGNVRATELVRAVSEKYPEISIVPIACIVREGMYVKKGDKYYQPFADKVVGR